MSTAITASLSQLDLQLKKTALFLDFDGTIADIVVDPTSVRVGEDTIENLAKLRLRLGGALAIVSGRPIEDIDARVRPLVLPVAGVHGLTRRNAGGVVEKALVNTAIVSAVAERLEIFVASHPGLLLEQKWGAIALHFRARPELAEDCYAALKSAASAEANITEFVHGKMVVEAKFAHYDKGKAVRSFMAESPFSGRRPIFIGDDITDEDGFAVAIAMGGIAAKVGVGPSLASVRFRDALDFRYWLGMITNQPEG